MKPHYLKTIFWQLRKLNIKEEERHEITKSIVGKTSLKECTDNEALKIIEHFSDLGAIPGKDKPKKKRAKGRRQLKRETGGVVHLITAAQRKTIDDVLGWNSDIIQDHGISLQAISKRVCGRDFPSTVKEAQAVIYALNNSIKFYSQREAKHVI